jgi:hypothetical protein
VSKRLLGYNPDTGMATWWHEDGEGWAVENAQYSAPILDMNKEASNHCNPYNAARDIRMTARIPLIVIAKWRNELGIDYWDQDPDVQRKVDRLLDDPDWRWLRADYGHAGHIFTAPASTGLIL